MAKLTICAAFLLAAVGGSYAADAWAADDMPTKASSATTPSTGAPRPCADPADFITTNCQLTWHGITLFGVVDMGFGWQSHGAPFDSISAVTSSYLIQKQNQGSMWTRAANAMSNSFIGIKGTETIGGDFSVVFDLDAGFDPLCVPKIRFCNIDGEGRQGRVVRRRRRGAQPRDGEGRPCSEIDGSSTHYNRRHIRVGSGAGALRQTRSCGRDIRGGSSR